MLLLCASSLLGCEGANEGISFSLGQARVDGLNGPSSPLSKLRLLVKVLPGYWTVLSFFARGWGLAIEGREMELLSFLAPLESTSNKENQFDDEMGRDQEEGGRSLFDGDMC